MTTPAPIVGKAGVQTSEAIVTGVTLTLLVLGAVFHRDLSSDVTVVSTAAVSIVSVGYAISRSITKNGVVRGLALQHAALAAAGQELVATVETVDPTVKPALDDLGVRLASLEGQVQTATAAVPAVDPTLAARLSALEARFAPIA